MRVSNDLLKIILLEKAELSEQFNFPLLKKTDFTPIKVINFSKSKHCKGDKWIHFYEDDSRFESLWNRPKQYLNLLKRFEGVITPDYSVYIDLPIIMQKWNTFRNRVLSYWLQSNGVNIIPNVRWGAERSYEFSFEGLERGGTVAIGSYGNIKKKENRYYFEKGLEKMVEVISPDRIICVGSMPDKIFKRYEDIGIELINFPGEASLVHNRGKL